MDSESDVNGSGRVGRWGVRREWEVRRVRWVRRAWGVRGEVSGPPEMGSH